MKFQAVFPDKKTQRNQMSLICPLFLVLNAHNGNWKLSVDLFGV